MFSLHILGLYTSMAFPSSNLASERRGRKGIPIQTKCRAVGCAGSGIFLSILKESRNLLHPGAEAAVCLAPFALRFMLLGGSILEGRLHFSLGGNGSQSVRTLKGKTKFRQKLRENSRVSWQWVLSWYEFFCMWTEFVRGYTSRYGFPTFLQPWPLKYALDSLPLQSQPGPLVYICFGQWHVSKYNSNSHLQHSFPQGQPSCWTWEPLKHHVKRTAPHVNHIGMGTAMHQVAFGKKRQNVRRDFFLGFDNCVVPRLISARRFLQIGFDASMDEFWYPDSGVQRAEEIKSPPVLIHSDFHWPLEI